MILVATSIPGADLPRVGVSHVDKVVHFALYGIWGLLLARTGPLPLAARRLAGLVALVALFAAADEWHQSAFIPGRDSDVLDWTADLVGASLALFLSYARPARPEPAS